MQLIKDMSEYRNIILEIMEYVQKVSEENGIQCFLSGGTLLGAIRHKGFIPWDDDADMMLLRKDYEKLIKIINSDESPYKALCLTTDFEYFLPFAKVVDTRTYVRDQHVPYKNNGVCVDLFPIDNLPGKKAKITKHYQFQKKLKDKFENLYCVDKSVLNNQVLIKLYQIMLKLVGTSMNAKARWYSKRIVSPRKVGCSVWGYGEREVIQYHGMNRAIDVTFEGRIFRAPIGYHQYLTNLYGDYMTPPPKTKQHNEHQARVWWR